MNLITLDFGNSRAHAALFRQGKLAHAGEAKDITSWLAAERLEVGDVAGILSQVRAYDEVLTELSQQGLLFEKIRDYWRGERFTGLPVHYAKTLGEDRLVQAWHVFKRFKTPTLIIGAGSFLTIDVVSSEGFMGGYILPGLGKLSDDLQEGEQLAAGNFSGIPKDLLTGEVLPRTTAEALQGSVVAYLSLIQKTMLRWGVGQLVLTGGDAQELSPLLKSINAGMEIHFEPHLIHVALRDWYQRNICP